MKIVEFLRADAVIANLSGQTGPAVLGELCRPIAAAQRMDAQRLVDTLLDREKLGSTGIGEGVAIPHGKMPGLPGLVASFGRSTAGVDFRAIDGRPTHLFLALLAPESAGAEHLQALARASRLLKRPAFRQALLDAPYAAEMYRLVVEEDRQL